MVNLKNTFYALSAIAFIVSSAVCSAETQIGLTSFKIDPNAEIEITADSMTFNSETNVTEFFDGVVVIYGQLKLTAKALKISQTNEPGTTKNIELDASGPIAISNNKSFIIGDRAVFNKENQELKIIGNVNLSQEGNIISGEELILNLKDGIAKIKGSVKTILGPIRKTKK